MNSVYLSRIVGFCRHNNATFILDYSNNKWDVMIVWGNNKIHSDATDFTRALRMAWRKIDEQSRTDATV